MKVTANLEKLNDHPPTPAVKVYSLLLDPV